ncbi:MAG: hypothetical protein HQL22_12075 [Candidatus Omnitrophica bacterium]|nr:hypothetical protein [Candidatus Omnitrophota bacterium]
MIIIQILFIIVVFVGLLVFSAKAEEQKAQAKNAVSSEQVQSMSREEIQRALKRIETKSAPAQKMGAMCYEMAASPENLEYVCPLDGEKTVYSRKSKAYGQAGGVVELRRLLNDLQVLAKGISFSLDERKLCSKCSPSIGDDDRKVSLIIKYGDGRIVQTDGVSSEDIRYLMGFFSDGLSYKTSNDGQLPLKQVDARLKELLGEKRRS